MFTDDTNFFYSHKNIKDLFYTINSELEKISQWFKTNKLSINIKKTKFTLYHEKYFKDEIPLKLPALMNSTKYSISIHGPKLQNDVFNKEEKGIQSFSLFQKKIKSKLIKNKNETDYF